MTRKGPFAVVWHNERISSVQPNDAPATQGETVIDVTGGTLVPGLYEMHGPISQGGALRNVAAGITSVRDMGNETDVRSEALRVGTERVRKCRSRVWPVHYKKKSKQHD